MELRRCLFFFLTSRARFFLSRILFYGSISDLMDLESILPLFPNDQLPPNPAFSLGVPSTISPALDRRKQGSVIRRDLRVRHEC